jgi:hypothetical protein
MKSCHFKFKPDKIKYLSTIDTLDSSHKNLINIINKKRINVPKKIKKLDKLKQELYDLEQINIQNPDYITVRSKLLDDIYELENDIKHIENYDEELEYYVKTHDILLNYYDLIDGKNMIDENKIINENKIEQNLEDNISKSDTLVKHKIENDEINDISDIEISAENKSCSKLDLLNMLSKNKRKDKKITKKRIKNLECLKNNNNDIFNYIDGNKHKNQNDSSDLNDVNNQIIKNSMILILIKYNDKYLDSCIVFFHISINYI